MDDETLQQAIQLSKDGRKLDARKLLRPFLEVAPENEKAWLWYANSFDSTDEKLKALQNCLVYCPDSKMALEGIRVLQSQLQSPEVETPEEPNNFAVNLQNSQGVKFFEADSNEKDNTPFSDEAESSKQISPFGEAPEQTDFHNSPFSNKQTQVNFGNQVGQTENSSLTSSQNAGYSESPFFAEEGISKEKKSTQQLLTDQGEWTGNTFRVPFFIASGLGVLLLLLLSVIIIVLFFVK
jgi:hypothetical protein